MLSKKYLRYLVPSVSAMWFYTINTMVNGMFVGRVLGTDAFAAIGLSMPYINTIFAIALIVAVGSSTCISYYLGMGLGDKANKTFTTTVIAMTVFGLAVAGGTLIFLDRVSLVMGASEATFGYVRDYLKIVSVFSTFFIVAYCLEVLVKADGYPSLSLRYVTLAGIINIALAYLLVYRLSLGIKGAAYAMGISHISSCIGFLVHFAFGKGKLKFVVPRIKIREVLEILKIGFPEAMTEMSLGFMIFVYNWVIIRYIGEVGLVAYGVLIQINTLVMLTMIGINQGTQPLLSYYYAAKDFNSVKKLTFMALKAIVGFSVMFFLISQLLGKGIVGLFIDKNSAEFATAVHVMKVFGFSYLVTGANVFISGYFTAIKKSKIATTLSVTRGYILMPIIVLSLPYIFGDRSIWHSALVFEVLALILGISLFFYRGVTTKEATIKLCRQLDSRQLVKID